MRTSIIDLDDIGIDDESIGARLRLARRALGLTQTDVAGRMDMVTSTVSAIEAGKRAVTGPELYSFAQMYGRPLAYFLEVPTVAPAPGFQFLLRAAAEKRIDRAPLVLLEQLCDDYDLLEELVGASPPSPPEYSSFGFHTDQDAETLAEMERSRLGLGDAPVGSLMDLLDSRIGIRTFVIPVPNQDWASVSAGSRGGRPCMAVALNEPVRRRTFRMAHEYGHVLARLSKSDAAPAHVEALQEGRRVSADERFAEAFASAFLMPRRAVLAQLERILRDNAGHLTDVDVVHLAMHFGVDGPALTLRLAGLRRLPRGMNKQDGVSGKRRFDVLASTLGYTVDDPGGIRDAPVVLPPRFRYLALRAYEEKQISLAKLAELLREDVHELRARLRAGAALVHG